MSKIQKLMKDLSRMGMASKEVADDFNKYFLPIENTYHIEDISSVESQDYEYDEFEKTIENFKPCIRVPMEKIKPNELTDEHLDHIYEIIEECFHTNLYPSELKLVQIRPTLNRYKKLTKEDKKELDNYFPVRITSIITDIVDYAIFQRFISSSGHFIDKYQYFFQPFIKKYEKHTCLLIDYLIYINEERSKNRYVASICFNFTDALENVSPNVVLKMFGDNSISPYLMNIIKSYLQNWNQYTSFEGEKSDCLKLKTITLTQRTMLTNTLLSIFFSNHPYKARHFNYKNKVNLVYSHTNLKNLEQCINNDLNFFGNYMAKYNLDEDIKEGKFLLFNPVENKSKTGNKTINLHILGTHIKRVKHFLLLDVNIDQELNFDMHTSNCFRQKVHFQRADKHFFSNNNNLETLHARATIMHMIYKNELSPNLCVDKYTNPFNKNDPIVRARVFYKRIPKDKKTTYSNLSYYINNHLEELLMKCNESSL